MCSKTKLGNLVKITKGKKHLESTFSVSSRRYIQIEDLSNSFNEKFTDENGVEVKENDIVIAWDGANAGKVGANLEGVIGSTLARLRILKGELNHNFFYRFLGSNFEFIKSRRTGATIPHVSGEALKNLQVPLPPLPTQKHIASILDKADALRQQNRQLLAHYDALLQSTFIEMFGDPVENPKGWEKAELKSISAEDGIKCGPFGSQLHAEDFHHEGVPLWGIKQVNKGFAIQTKEFLTEQKAKELKTYSIEPFDIVMTRKGTIGNCAVYPNGWKNGIMHSDLLRIRVNSSVCDPTFLSSQLKFSQDIIHQISLISSGAIMAGINVGKLKKIFVLFPPLLLQQHFAKIVEEIESQKQQAQTSLAESEALFQGLLAGYFGEN